MAHYLRVADLKENLTSCPICFHCFDEEARLPRRMPCCLKAICHTCLETLLNRHGNTLTCPMCRGEHTASSASSFPEDRQILGILEFVNLQRGIRIPCTDCPDGNEAIKRCEDCCIFLCSQCLAAHSRTRETRNHVTASFDELRARSVNSLRRNHVCREHGDRQQFYCLNCNEVICISCIAYKHKDHDYIPVDEAQMDKEAPFNAMLDDVAASISEFDKTSSKQKEQLGNLKMSGTYARKLVEQTFNSLLSQVEARRDEVLAAVHEKEEGHSSKILKRIESNEIMSVSMKSALEHVRELRDTSDAIEELQLMSYSSPTLQSMSKQRPADDGTLVRTGLTFSPVYIRQISELVKVAGVVRGIKYEDSPKPDGLIGDGFYQAIVQEPAEVPTVPQMEMMISRDSGVTCPSLEFDAATASEHVTVLGGKVTNIEPDPSVPDSGCRMTPWGRTLTTTPLTIGQTDQVYVAGKASLTVKNLDVENKVLWEMALTPLPVNSCCNQMSGVSVLVRTCSIHVNQLCLDVVYDGELISDTPLTDYKVGKNISLNLGFLLDGNERKLLIINTDTREVVSTLPNVNYDRPLWGLMDVDTPDNTDVTGELISGRDSSPDIVQLRVLHRLIHLFTLLFLAYCKSATIVYKQ